MTETTKKRRPVKRWIILALFAAGIYAAFIGPSILKPVSPVVVMPAEPTGLAIFGFQITNTILATLITDVLLILLAVGAYRFSKTGSLVPKGFYNAFEAIFEFLWNSIEGSAGKWAKRILPIPATIFLLIFVANMIKLLPGFESIGQLKQVHEGTGYAPVKLFNIGKLNVYTIDKGHPVDVAAAVEHSSESETGAETEAHGDSPASRELVRRKVKGWVCMGGRYPRHLDPKVFGIVSLGVYGIALGVSAGTIFVVVAIAVVVNSLGIELIDPLLALQRVGLFEEPGLLGYGHPFAGRILDSHQGHKSVSVEIIGTILVGCVIAVLVDARAVARIPDERLHKKTGRSVGVPTGKNVPGSVGAKGGGLEDELGQINRGLPRNRNRPLHVGGHEYRGKRLPD